MMKKVFAVLLAISMAGSLVACGGSTTASSSSEPAAEETAEAPAEETEAAEATADTAAGSDLKYAVILKTTATDFWLTMNNGIDEYAKANGLSVDLYAAQSDTDYEGQLAILEQAVNSGEYAGIAIAPCNGVNAISGVKAANEKGITIVDIDEQFDEAEMTAQGATCVAYASSDNEAIGKMGAAYLASQLEAGSKVAIVEGIAGNASSEARKNGATAGFEEAGMEIIASTACDWDMQKALDAVATWITQEPDLKAVYCCNDGMAMGAMQAIINAGKVGEILLCGTDGDASAIEAVAAGNMTATVAQDSAGIGVKCLEMLVDAVANPDKYPASAAPEKTPIDGVLVTSENAADYVK